MASSSLSNTLDLQEEGVRVCSELLLFTEETPPKLQSPPSTNHQRETAVENQVSQVRLEQTAHPGRRNSRDPSQDHRRRRTGLRRQSSSPGPPPLLIRASHFENGQNEPTTSRQTTTTTITARERLSAPSPPVTEMAAVDFDELAERLQREEDESVALARMLMAEEAMESYVRSADFLQRNAQYYSPEDLQALQAVLQENEEDDEEGSDDELSYETMVRLGERIGDVKSERWALIAREEINKLEEFAYCQTTNSSETVDCMDDSTVKCLVCQFTYEQNERLRRLPCGHCFHSNCVGSWLMEKDSCPYCRQPVIPDHDY